MLKENNSEWYKVYKKLADELANFYTNWNNFKNENSKNNYKKVMNIFLGL